MFFRRQSNLQKSRFARKILTTIKISGKVTKKNRVLNITNSFVSQQNLVLLIMAKIFLGISRIFVNVCGLQNIDFNNVETKKIAPINIYTSLLITATLFVELARMYFYEIDLIKLQPHFNIIIYVIRNKIDVICTIFCWISELSNYSNKLLHDNLRQIDSMLFNRFQDELFTKKYIKTYIIYAIYKTVTSSFDLFVWNFADGQLFSMLKHCIVELVILKFVFEMSEFLKRLRILNEKLAILHCGEEFVELKTVDFRNHSGLVMLENEEVDVKKFKSNEIPGMKNIIRAYCIISDNTKRIESFYGFTVSRY